MNNVIIKRPSEPFKEGVSVYFDRRILFVVIVLDHLIV
jgi:hypothetical protein